MQRILNYVLILAVVGIGLIELLLAWSFHAEQERFRAAKNDCERACIQDSGGLKQCRADCMSHPNRYP